jgi:hypothetical protein
VAIQGVLAQRAEVRVAIGLIAGQTRRVAIFDMQQQQAARGLELRQEVAQADSAPANRRRLQVQLERSPVERLQE